MTLQTGITVLRDKYQLLQKVEDVHDVQPYETWIAKDDNDSNFLIKTWPYFSDNANELQRALWDAELRSMYRVSSSPGAEGSLLVVRDAGLDKKNKCFIMVMVSFGSDYARLIDALQNRKEYMWLSNREPDSRVRLWRGLKQIALGIQLLHSQAILHRNISAENIYFHPDNDPSTFRLGGFEWSLRVGERRIGQLPHGWATPPEISKSLSIGFRQEMDWYGFGVLVARCLLNIEDIASSSTNERYEKILEKIQKSDVTFLSDLEKQVLLRLIDHTVDNRLMRAQDIISAIDEIISSLYGADANRAKNPLLLIYNPSSSNIVDMALDAGFIPDEKDSDEYFNPLNPMHVNYLSSFIQQDLSEAILYHISEKSYILIGRQLSFKITRYKNLEGRYGWEAAFVLDAWGLRNNDGGTESRELPINSIKVRTQRDLSREPSLIAESQNWKRYLPFEDTSSNLKTNLANLYDFIRCTNQLELLMRDSELFQYEILEHRIEEQTEYLVIKEIDRQRPAFMSLQLEGGLAAYMQREVELNTQKDTSLVVLTPENQAVLRLDKVDPKECFSIGEIDIENKLINLRRTAIAGLSIKPPQKGWIRTFSMFGQIELVRRRKEAIERLTSHSYLLRSILAPGQSFISTGDIPFPAPVPDEQVDIAKQSVMKDILTTRPIYALQGPPGTGKTTMVAHLLRQIFADDPVAQVLVTAQAHGAVDVLRNKVNNDAFGDVAEENLPLAIRLARPDVYTEDTEELQEGSVEFVARQILDRSIKSLSDSLNLSALQKEWINLAREMRDAIRTSSTDALAQEFCELVKRGANITYSTTSAGDLEELARDLQSYDWAIVEEAGKCHGFDLALPLQAGHRWLLIGDQSQLPAYRIKDFLDAINELDEAVKHLVALPDRASKLLDFEWINKWRALDDTQKEKFKEFCKEWLKTFEAIFKRCEKATGRESLTIDKPIGAAAGMLSMQYRMHPSIGTLISESYYGGKIKNLTVDENGNALDRVRAPIKSPKIFEDKNIGILWLEMPPAWENADAAEKGGAKQSTPRYTNPMESETIKMLVNKLELRDQYIERIRIGESKPLKLAVLSPYNQQVGLLRKTLRDYSFPVGIEPKEALQAKSGRSTSRLKFVHTVDSFQGNEADIIIVSLVRNNMRQDPATALGFLKEAARTNVLLSRAQRLLVLVGSWEFFVKQVSLIPPEDDTREEWKFRRAITLLDEWFKTGQAVKVNWDAFAEKIK
ncbi:MAG: AAA family ATPase [Anaerolineales bacterium]|nr:AAA family ATPase [Anaerolineales bacterium]